MTISPISSSMMSMYVPAAASADKKPDYEEQMILQELALYGIAPSGDKDADKAKLEIAKRIASQQSQGAESSSSRRSIPFEDIMNTLNLAITGNLEDDYETTINKLDYEISLAYTDEEKAYYQALKDQVETDYVSAKQNSFSSFTGASQLGSLNRLMFGL